MPIANHEHDFTDPAEFTLINEFDDELLFSIQMNCSNSPTGSPPECSATKTKQYTIDTSRVSHTQTGNELTEQEAEELIASIVSAGANQRLQIQGEHPKPGENKITYKTTIGKLHIHYDSQNNFTAIELSPDSKLVRFPLEFYRNLN